MCNRNTSASCHFIRYVQIMKDNTKLAMVSSSCNILSANEWCCVATRDLSPGLLATSHLHSTTVLPWRLRFGTWQLPPGYFEGKLCSTSAGKQQEPPCSLLGCIWHECVMCVSKVVKLNLQQKRGHLNHLRLWHDSHTSSLRKAIRTFVSVDKSTDIALITQL